MKKEKQGLLTVLAGIHQDIRLYGEKTKLGLDLTFRQVETILETRGIDFLTISMPELGKLVDKGLSSGHIDMPSVFSILGRTKKTFPKRWGRIFLMVFTEDGVLRDSVDPNWVFFLRQLCYFAKKLKKECSDEAVDNTISDFLQIDDSLPLPFYGWGSGSFDRDSLHGVPHLHDGCSRRVDDREKSLGGHTSEPTVTVKLADIMQSACDWLTATMGEFDPHSVVPKHGSGAVADQGTGRDRYRFPTWPSLLATEFYPEVHTVVNEGVSSDVIQLKDEVIPAKLIAVPKTLKGPRLIASEPVCNQYIQQGILKWLRENTPKAVQKSTNFYSQEPNRERALLASRSGQFATVDLSSASDYLSCWLVERVFRRNLTLLKGLNASRSNELSWKKKSGESGVIRLRKFSHQGSAVTFPVQTLTYYLAALAVRMYNHCGCFDSRRVESLSRDIRVFGDDIICPTDDLFLLGHLLSYVGMKVNRAKTHYSGSFRESCGMDAFAGCEVTPAYMSYAYCNPRNPESIVSMVEVANNFHRSGLWKAAQSVESMIPSWVRYTLPVSSSALGCLSLSTFQEGYQAPTRLRYNYHLQRWEVRAPLTKTKVKRELRDDMQSLLQWFLESPDRFADWRSGYQTARPKIKLIKGWVPIR